MRKFLALACWVALIGGAASGSARPLPETIAIHSRHAVAICAGICLDYDITVDSSGTLKSRKRMVSDAHWTVKHFRVTPAQFAAFRAKLAAIRPMGVAALAGDCGLGDIGLAGVIPLQIEWTDSEGTSRLESCATPDVVEVEQAALLALRFSAIWQRPLSAEEVADRAEP